MTERGRMMKRIVVAVSAIVLTLGTTPPAFGHTESCFGTNNVSHSNHGDQSGPSPDTFNGGAGANAFAGLLLDDTLNGGGGQDKLCGNPDSDTIHGDAGGDEINAGDNRDQAFGDDGNDYIHGGAFADDPLQGNKNADIVGGDKGDDIINGGDGLDDVIDGDGLDTLRGGNGADDFLVCENDGEVDLTPDFNPAEGDLAFVILRPPPANPLWDEWCDGA